MLSFLLRTPARWSYRDCHSFRALCPLPIFPRLHPGMLPSSFLRKLSELPPLYLRSDAFLTWILGYLKPHRLCLVSCSTTTLSREFHMLLSPPTPECPSVLVSSSLFLFVPAFFRRRLVIAPCVSFIRSKLCTLFSLSSGTSSLIRLSLLHYPVMISTLPFPHSGP